MRKNPRKIQKKRMIHIRLDEKTHRALRILAAKGDITIQGVVEELIRRRVFEETDD